LANTFDGAMNKSKEQCFFPYSNNSRMCGSCAQGFSHKDLTGRCDRCPDEGSNYFFAAVGVCVGVIGCVVFVLISLSDEGKLEASDGIKAVLLSFIQLVSLLSTFPIAWPDLFITIFHVGGSAVALGQHFVNLKCAVPEYTDADVFFAINIVWASVPILMCAVTVGVWVLISCCKSVVDVRTKMGVSCVALLNLIWPSLCSQTFSIFACKSICGQDTSYLLADMNVQCGVGRHLTFVWCVGVPMLILYALGLPFGAFVVVWRLHTSAEEQKDIDEEQAKIWGMLYSVYRGRWWAWEWTVAGRKIAVAAIGVFGSQLGLMQVHLTMMLVVVILLVTGLVQPFHGEAKFMLFSLELLALVAAWLVLWAGSVFNAYPRCMDRGVEGTLPWCDALSIFVGLFVTLVLVTCVVCFVQQKMLELKRDKLTEGEKDMMALMEGEEGEEGEKSEKGEKGEGGEESEKGKKGKKGKKREKGHGAGGKEKNGIELMGTMMNNPLREQKEDVDQTSPELTTEPLQNVDQVTPNRPVATLKNRETTETRRKQRARRSSGIKLKKIMRSKTNEAKKKIHAQDEEWIEVEDPVSHKKYYYQQKSGMTSWEKPDTM